jgi:hypothetical protein
LPVRFRYFVGFQPMLPGCVPSTRNGAHREKFIAVQAGARIRATDLEITFPFRPEMVIASSGNIGSDVAMNCVFDHRKALNEFYYAFVERVDRPVAGFPDTRVGNDIIALVRVLTDGRLQESEIR